MKKRAESGTDITQKEEKEISNIAGTNQKMIRMKSLKVHPFVNRQRKEDLQVCGLKENKLKCFTSPKKDEEKPDVSAAGPIM